MLIGAEIQSLHEEIIHKITPYKGSRVWVYQSDRILSKAEVATLTLEGQAFAEKWAAHGVDLKAGFFTLFDLFLVLVVDEDAHQPSGCSIDSSLKFIRETEKAYQINLLNRMNLALWIDEEWKIVHKSALQELFTAGQIDGNTITTDNLVNTANGLSEKFSDTFGTILGWKVD